MKRWGPTVAIVIAVVILWAHRSAVHAAATWFVYGLAAVAGLAALCLIAAAAGHLRALTRPAPAVTRARLAAVRPASPQPVASGRPEGLCSVGCGRPAARLFGKWPVCDECGGRLDDADGRPARDDDGPAAPAVAVTVPEVRQWAFGPDGEPLPDGESMLHYLDMTDYEKDLNQ